MKLLIVDDEKLIREGLKIILSSFDDIEVVGLCGDGYEAVEFCKQNEVEIVLMDIRMPNCNGVMGTRLIKEQFHNIKILVLTTFKDEEYIHEALNYGASGYLLKDSSHELIYEGLKSVHKGNVVFHPEIANKMIERLEGGKHEVSGESFGLSEKEINIIKLIAEGFTNKEISEKLYLSEGTIKNNITNILSKLSLRDRTQIAIFAFKNGIVT
ncbi:MAG: response regulator transcription factor [Clostridium sp.]